MQTVKQNLLNNLEDINTVFDHNDLEKQNLFLSSFYTCNNIEHEMHVYVDVEIKENRNIDGYYTEHGYEQLTYDISEIDTITITDIFVFEDGCDSDVTFTKEEITEYLNGTIKN